MKRWLCLAGAIITEVSATLALKAAIEAPGWYLVVVFGYVTAFFLLSVCLRLGMTISVAYGAWGAGGVTATALLSASIFDEPLTWLMGAGMVLILAGVITVEVGSQKAHAKQEEQA
ncbi:QacE family quaternary ammonium compound efflux SMR transporter [Pseudarthrobacter sp. NamE2]|uniref:DMT family transporter n=1 Tax=Pseudarthrobacter sp. NamE2 TaxID=2576838 RepID=UPI0010FE60CA|nr:SMR family transporter [Pseudarthrobacter sp. NamE2]TLM81397.1 QacE family quaternary ammonium compound efflux SMR transporter [Pseudarthrobacter sp. NamE2]